MNRKEFALVRCSEGHIYGLQTWLADRHYSAEQGVNPHPEFGAHEFHQNTELQHGVYWCMSPLPGRLGVTAPIAGAKRAS